MTSQRKQFDDETRQRIREKCFDELRRTKHKALDQRKTEIDWWLNHFIVTLECFADGTAELPALYPPPSQRRTEQIVSLSKALQRVVDAYSELDSGAKRYVLSECAAELAKVYGEENPYPNTLETGELIYENEASWMHDIQIIASAAEHAAYRLPKPNNPPPKLCLAKHLDSFFLRISLQFSASETGFAAFCFREVLALAGLDDEKSVSYWLREAKKPHPLIW